MWNKIQGILESLPEGTPVKEARKIVSAELGVEFSTWSFRYQCAEKLGHPPSYFIGKAPKRSVESIVDAGLASGGMLRVVATGDWHSPYHSDAAMGCFFRALDAIKPDVVVLLGDHVDCYTVSRFSKAQGRVHTFLDEIQVTNELLDMIKAPEVHYIEGNHEARLDRYISEKAPELHGVTTMRQQLKIDARGWKWHDYRGESLKIGKMAFKHDIGRCGKYALHHTLADFGGNITFGHTHGGGTIYQSTVKGSHRVALNTGWLGDVEAVDYRHREMARRDYIHGFGLIYIDKVTGHAYAQFKPIVGGRVEVEGKLI